MKLVYKADWVSPDPYWEGKSLEIGPYIARVSWEGEGVDWWIEYQGSPLSARGRGEWSESRAMEAAEAAILEHFESIKEYNASRY